MTTAEAQSSPPMTSWFEPPLTGRVLTDFFTGDCFESDCLESGFCGVCPCAKVLTARTARSVEVLWIHRMIFMGRGRR